MAASPLKSASECLTVARCGLDWLLANQNTDGTWKPLDQQAVDGFYKGSWSLGLMGKPEAAERSLEYAKQHFMDESGDFSPRLHPWHREVHYLYANSYFAVGAHKIGRYDISVPATRFILSQQSTAHGGFFTRKTAPGGTNMADTMSTGACGVALLATGEIEAAERAAAWFDRMIELQPAPTHRFFIGMDSSEALITEYAADESFWRCIDVAQPNQCWYAVGLPYSFLVQLYQATGNQHYLDQAIWFLDFQRRCVNPWHGGSSGKAGWGSSMLYRMTGDQQYREIALTVAGNIASLQSPVGGWFLGRNSVYGEGDSFKPSNGDFDASAEFVLWLGLIAENLLARDSQ